MKEKQVKVKGRWYWIRITHYMGSPCWEVFRSYEGESNPNYRAKIPAMTRSDCAKFPREVARVAQSMLEGVSA